MLNRSLLVRAVLYKALREELQRTRAKTLESVSDIGDGGRIKEAMEELERLVDVSFVAVISRISQANFIYTG